MARIRPLDPDEVDSETRALFESHQRDRGYTPNMTRTMAYRPALAATAAAHQRAIMEAGTVERRLKEMLAVRVSQVNQCYY